jgi:hypothetical protein
VLVELSKMEQKYDAVLGVIRDGYSVSEVAQRHVAAPVHLVGAHPELR